MFLPLRYNVRNLVVRKLSTSLTLIVVAVLVLVLSVLLSFAAGIRESLRATGSPLNVIILKPGATAESTSLIRPAEGDRVIQAPGIARDVEGRPLVSKELYVQTTVPRRGETAKVANVAVRGVDPAAFDVHSEVRIVQGRCFQQGAMEIIVGIAAHERYVNVRIGDEVTLGRLANRGFKIVGVFEAGGGALENEFWGPRTIITDAYQRPFLSSIVVRVKDAKVVPETMSYVDGPSVNLSARSEPDYYEELSSKTREIVSLTTILVGIMSVGAVFAVANTMYATVDGRRREVAMLRTIGFRPAAIVLSFVLESVLICLAACSLGLLASRPFSGTRQDYLSDTTWTVLAYKLELTPTIALSSLVLALLVGVVGALAPALKASNMPLITALRRA